MEIQELYKLPGIEEVFINENYEYIVQGLRSLDDYYININEKIFGPFNGYVEMLEFMVARYIEIYEKRDILINKLEDICKEVIRD